ncbi:MAG: ATP synthase F0 subunit B [Thermodesulfobacteriota bacterium]|nr:ATP synthase F0 subunit B [Thermodesulfobacteriota bacterium]
MKADCKTKNVFLVGGAFLVLLLGGAIAAIASESGTGHDWRPIYDNVMLWVNFLILAFVLYRVGKDPIKNFLAHKQTDVADEIKTLEEKKDAVKAEVRETELQVAESDRHIQRIKARVIEEGEQIKQKIIEDAESQREYMIAESRKKASSRFREARQAFREELIDEAVAIAADRLPLELKTDDRDRMFNAFVDQIASAGERGLSS